MTPRLVCTQALFSEAAERYFTTADKRVMIGLRAALELLDLPTPEYAIRRKPGPTPARRVAAAYVADNPGSSHAVLQARKPNATLDQIYAARLRAGQA